jgi:hypothetical protein
MTSTFEFLPKDERWFLAYDAYRDHKPTAQLTGYGESLYNETVADLVARGHDVWTARAGFDGAAASRTAKQVVQLQCFSIDIDIDARGHVGKTKVGRACHPTRGDAIRSLAALVVNGVIPRPSVLVSSGGGLHVWWRLAKPVPPKLWAPAAKALRDAILGADPMLAADTTRWVDSSGLLRPWPSVNWKTGAPRPVQVLKSTGAVYAVAEFAAHFAVAAPPPETNRRITGAPAKTRAATGADKAPRTLVPLADLEATCGVLRHYRAHLQDNASEPQWRAALSAVCSTVEWESAIHTYSEGHPDYDPRQTEAKAEAIIAADAPISCGRLRHDIMGDAEDRSACAGCPFASYSCAGNINTLGATREYVLSTVPARKHKEAEERRRAAAAVAEFDSLETVEDLESALGAVELPSYIDLIPNGQNRYYIARLSQDDNEGAVYGPVRSGMTSVQIFQPAWWVDRHVGSRSLIAWMRGGETQTAYIRRDSLSTYDAMIKELAGHGIAAPADRNNDVKHATLAYAKLMHDRPQRVNAYDNCGLQPDETIVIGAVGVQRDGRVQRSALHPRFGAQVLNRVAPAGWLQAQRDLLGLVGQHGSLHAKLAIICSFGSLLLGLTSSQGAMVHLYGPADTGKSMTQAIAASVWGRPREFMQSGQDTLNSLMASAGFLGSLPLIVDELTLMREHDVDTLAYSITAGRPKRANTRNGGDRDASPPWAFNAITSANRSVRAIISALSDDEDDDAKQSRVLELRFTHAVEGGAEKQHEVLARAHQLVDRNYGLLGIEWARHVAMNSSRIRDTLRRAHASLATRHPMCRRFIGATLASFLVAANELRALGLWPCTQEDDIAVVREALRQVAVTYEDEKADRLSFTAREVMRVACANALVFKSIDGAAPVLLNTTEAPRDPWARVEIDSLGQTWIEAPVDAIVRVARDAARPIARRALLSRRVTADVASRRLQDLRNAGVEFEIIDHQLLFRGAPLRLSHNSGCRVIRMKGAVLSAEELRGAMPLKPRIVVSNV